MYVFKVELAVFIFCYFLLQSQGLEKALKEENIILATESALRNNTNKLFMELHLKKLNPKLRKSLLVHNFFTSVTLKDHKTLNLIVKLSRVDKKDENNKMEHFVGVLNEILNEESNGVDDEVDSLAHNEDVIQYIDEFLNNVDGFKESSGFNANYESFDLKDEIVHVLQSDYPISYNATQSNATTKENSEEDGNLLSDIEFWVPEPERRIYKGYRTKIKYFPFMASIHIFNGFQCAGSIIKSDLILTAASCLQLAWNNRFFRENPAFLSARVGSNFYAGGGEGIPILEVYFHPDYTPKNLRNNIAVLRLLRQLKFRRHKRRLKKIEIDRHASSLPMSTDGITIVGWGAKGPSSIVRDPWSNQLAFAVLDVYHLQECQNIYSREYVTRTNFCAGFISKGGGACNHDVGGPGIVNGILKGVISFGSPVCGTPDAPTVFTKVGFYADWIEEIMEQEVPSTKRRTTLRYSEHLSTRPQRLRPTTFSMVPLGARTTKSLPHYDSDTLRMLEEEEVFKEFLSTMFDTKEVKEYADILNEFSANDLENFALAPHARDNIIAPEIQSHKQKTKANQRILKEYEKIIKPVTRKPDLYTKMFATESKREKHPARDVNVLEGESGYDDIVENDIVKLINGIDMSDTDEKTSSSDESKELMEEAINEKRSKKHFIKNRNDKVLTLLYLPDNEISNANISFNNIDNAIEDFDDNESEGLSIAEEGFHNDPSFINNKTYSVLDIISKNELYDLLSEAIEEVALNKTRKRL